MRKYLSYVDFAVSFFKARFMRNIFLLSVKSLLKLCSTNRYNFVPLNLL